MRYTWVHNNAMHAYQQNFALVWDTWKKEFHRNWKNNYISYRKDKNALLFTWVLYLSGSAHSGHAVNEFGAEEDIGIVEHTILERDHDELQL